MSLQFQNESSGELHVLEEKRISIGSADRSHILDKDPDVPATQCILSKTKIGYFLMSYTKEAPTTINGEPTEEKMLKVGDRILIGESTFVLEASDAEREAGAEETDIVGTHAGASVDLHEEGKEEGEEEREETTTDVEPEDGTPVEEGVISAEEPVAESPPEETAPPAEEPAAESPVAEVFFPPEEAMSETPVVEPAPAPEPKPKKSWLSRLFGG